MIDSEENKEESASETKDTTKTSSSDDNKKNEPNLDSLGRSYATGKRKNAVERARKRNQLEWVRSDIKQLKDIEDNKKTDDNVKIIENKD